jgi:hypothetical protein
MSGPVFNLGAFREKEKLKTDGSNFTTWFRTLKIILTPHKMGYVLDAVVGAAPKPDTPKVRFLPMPIIFRCYIPRTPIILQRHTYYFRVQAARPSK